MRRSDARGAPLAKRGKNGIARAPASFLCEGLSRPGSAGVPTAKPRGFMRRARAIRYDETLPETKRESQPMAPHLYFMGEG